MVAVPVAAHILQLPPAFEIERHVGVDAIIAGFAVFDFGCQFLDVNRANVSQCFRRLSRKCA
jgi:hypothetical protein